MGGPDVATVSVADATGSGARRLAFATDLGAASMAAERAAIDLARRLRAELLVINVIDPGGLRLPGGRFRRRMDEVRGERETAVAGIVARATSQGIGARFLVWQGDPGPGLLEAAMAEAADLIVVGSHRRGRLGRLILGSVSTYVVEHAPVPVLVVRGEEVVRYEPIIGTTRPAIEGGSRDA
jgi:nucleotide-binding universal stress UspA family protein